MRRTRPRCRRRRKTRARSKGGASRWTRTRRLPCDTPIPSSAPEQVGAQRLLRTHTGPTDGVRGWIPDCHTERAQKLFSNEGPAAPRKREWGALPRSFKKWYSRQDFPTPESPVPAPATSGWSGEGSRSVSRFLEGEDSPDAGGLTDQDELEEIVCTTSRQGMRSSQDKGDSPGPTAN